MNGQIGILQMQKSTTSDLMSMFPTGKNEDITLDTVKDE